MKGKIYFGLDESERDWVVKCLNMGRKRIACLEDKIRDANTCGHMRCKNDLNFHDVLTKMIREKL